MTASTKRQKLYILAVSIAVAISSIIASPAFAGACVDGSSICTG